MAKGRRGVERSDGKLFRSVRHAAQVLNREAGVPPGTGHFEADPCPMPRQLHWLEDGTVISTPSIGPFVRWVDEYERAVLRLAFGIWDAIRAGTAFHGYHWHRQELAPVEPAAVRRRAERHAQAAPLVRAQCAAAAGLSDAELVAIWAAWCRAFVQLREAERSDGRPPA